MAAKLQQFQADLKFAKASRLGLFETAKIAGEIDHLLREHAAQRVATARYERIALEKMKPIMSAVGVISAELAGKNLTEKGGNAMKRRQKRINFNEGAEEHQVVEGAYAGSEHPNMLLTPLKRGLRAVKLARSVQKAQSLSASATAPFNFDGARFALLSNQQAVRSVSAASFIEHPIQGC